MERMLDKKANSSDFLTVFRMGCKAAESTGSTEHLAQELLTPCAAGGSGSFVRDEPQGNVSGYSSGIDNERVRAITKLIFLTPWEVAKKLNIAHSTVVRHLKQIGKVKKLTEVSHDKLTENQKVVLKCLPLFCATMNCFSIGLWRATRSGFYMTNSDKPVQLVVGLRGSSTALPKALLAPKKERSHSLVVCCLSDPL